MSKSESLSSTSKNEVVQLPVKGSYVEVDSERFGWKKLIEGMGDGRFRIHMVKIGK